MQLLLLLLLLPLVLLLLLLLVRSVIDFMTAAVAALLRSNFDSAAVDIYLQCLPFVPALRLLFLLLLLVVIIVSAASGGGWGLSLVAAFSSVARFY